MRSSFSVLVALMALSLAASRGLAQPQRTDLETGARVRLTSPTLRSDQQVVRIVSLTSDTVAFRSDQNPTIRSLALNDISAVEVSLGERRRTGQGAIIGFLAGAAIGGVLGYTIADESCVPTVFGCGEIFSPGESAGVLGLVGGAAGLLVGTTMGWFAKSERWRRLPLNAHPAIVPSRGGFLVSISRPF
jgi:hypothetical protein